MWYNTFMIFLLRSPLHQILSKNMIVLTVSGRKSGKSYSVPVNFQRAGNSLLTTSRRERTWWRNLRGGAPVTVLYGGKDVPAVSHVIEEPEAVFQGLREYLRLDPQVARYLQVGLDDEGLPREEDVRKLVESRVVIRTDLQTGSN